jgi:transposase
VPPVRYVAAAGSEYQFDDDPTDNIARALDEIRTALIEGKIPIEWVEDRYGRGFNPYVLYGIDEPRSDLEWAIGYIAEEAAIPDPRPSHITRDYITELRRLRQLRLLKTRVLELWPNRSAVQSDGSKHIAGMQATRSTPSKEQLEARVREELRAIYKTSRPNMNVAEQRVRSVTGAKRPLIRDILKEAEFSQRRLPPGNSRRSNT